MAIEYWYKKQTNTGFENITNQVLSSHQIKGNESINDLPGGFTIGITPYKKYGNSTIITSIDINIGDEILVLDGFKFIAYGKVWDAGRKPIFFDRKTNKSVCEFYPKVIQPDFSDHSIDSVNFENQYFSNVCSELFLHSDGSIGVDGVGKYKLNFEDFLCSFSSSQKGLQTMCAELAQQNDLFFVMKTFPEYLPDDDRVFLIRRYVEFNSKSGASPSDDDPWLGGITNITFRDGTVKNGFIKIPAEEIPTLEEDTSQICNSISLNCKIFSGSGLSIYEKPAKANTVDYDINNYASDIVYVGIWTKDNVKILAGSTSSTVKIPSRYATTIEEGNTAYFKDSSTDFFTVNSVNKVDSTYTEIGFSPSLPFTPAENDIFEIVGNVQIYKKEEDVNYSSTGCLVDLDLKSFAKVHFLDLSEPNPTQRIFFVFRKIVDYPIKLKNVDSIKKYGLKHKEIKLDDSILLTSLEANNLASNALQLEPNFKYKVVTRRSGIAPIGMASSIRVSNLIDKVLILNSIEYELLTNRDYNKKPIFLQTLEFSNQSKDINRTIERYKSIRKNTSTTQTTLNKNIQKETISISEQIRWGRIRQGLENPTQLEPTSVSDTTFQMNWYVVDSATSYLIEVYLDEDLTDLLFSNEVYSDCFYIVTEDDMDGNDKFYTRVKAKNNLMILESDWSNTIVIETAIADWDYSGFTNGFYLNFENEDLTDKTALETPTGTVSGYTSAKWYGRKAVIMNGSSDVIYVNNSHMSNDTSYNKLLLEAQFELSDNLSNGQTMILFSRERYFGSGIGEFRMGLYKTGGLTYISADFYNNDYSPNFVCRLQNQVNFVKDTKYSLIYSVDFQNKYQTCNVNKTNYSGSMLDVGLKSFADFNYMVANRSGGTSTKIGREGYSDGDKFAGKLWRVLLTLGTFKNSTIADSEQERFGF